MHQRHVTTSADRSSSQQLLNGMSREDCQKMSGRTSDTAGRVLSLSTSWRPGRAAARPLREHLRRFPAVTSRVARANRIVLSSTTSDKLYSRRLAADVEDPLTRLHGRPATSLQARLPLRLSPHTTSCRCHPTDC